MAATGPKISSRVAELPCFTRSSTVGATKWPRSRPAGRPPPASSVAPSDTARSMAAVTRVERGPGDDRSHVGLGAAGIADHDAPGLVDKLGDEAIRDGVDHVEPLGRGAHLPAIQVAGPGRTPRRHVEIGVLADDEGVDTAGLEVDLLQRIGGDPHDALANRGRSRERNHVGAAALHQRLASFGAGAGDDADHALREHGEGLGQRQRGHAASDRPA